MNPKWNSNFFGCQEFDKKTVARRLICNQTDKQRKRETKCKQKMFSSHFICPLPLFPFVAFGGLVWCLFSLFYKTLLAMMIHFIGTNIIQSRIKVVWKQTKKIESGFAQYNYFRRKKCKRVDVWVRRKNTSKHTHTHRVKLNKKYFWKKIRKSRNETSAISSIYNVFHERAHKRTRAYSCTI